MTDDADIPDSWIPLHNDKAGPIYIQTKGNGLTLIRYREDTSNDVISFYDFEVTLLLHKLVDYIGDDL